jgi:hypothetical protein
VLRERVLARRGFFAAVDRVDGERLAAAVVDFARVDAGFLAAVVLRAVLLRGVDFALVDVLRALAERFAPVLRADVDPPLELSSAAHLPDMTRCAASATASAINVPSFVALAITLLAACDAVSAASRPASRIALRAFGLALIAAAAAARPAASISLLIAALASLSTVSFFVEEPDELLRADLAIASSPSVGNRHFSAVTVPERSRKSVNLRNLVSAR